MGDTVGKNTFYFKNTHTRTKRGISFSFAGTEKSVDEAFKRYTLDLLLKKINYYSVVLIQNKDKKNDLPGTRVLCCKAVHANSRSKEDIEVYLNGWSLIDAAYLAIKHTNDFRGKELTEEDEFIALMAVESGFAQRKEAELLENNEGGDNDFFFYLWGFCGEQFKYERLGRVFDNASRELFMIFECSKEVCPNLNFGTLIEQDLGIKWENITAYLLLAWFQSTRNSVLTELEDIFQWDDGFSYSDYVKILNKYTSTYNEVRSSPLRRQIFYTKPFIKTDRTKEIISVNSYFDLFLYEHSVLWIIRDIYKGANDQGFTSIFGQLFENYFKRLLNYYLLNNEYERIPEEKEKRADWKLSIDGFEFLIEQKAGLLNLSAKQQESDVNATKKYSERTIIKALRQLQKTELDFGKKYIKVVLLYEDYIKPEVLQNIFELEECDVIDDNYYWLVDIYEMEMLLSLAKDNRERFDKVIRAIIDRHRNHSHNGNAVETVLNEYGIHSSAYIRRPEIEKYRAIPINIVRNHFRASDTNSKIVDDENLDDEDTKN